MYNAPTLEECGLFLNKTQKYMLDGSYTAITDLSQEFRDIKYPIRELGMKIKSQNDGEIPQTTTVLYETKDQMLQEALNFFYSISPNYGAAIAKVIKDPEIHDNIRFQKVGYSTGYTTLTSDNKIQIKLDITPTAEGMIALCQELANAHVLSQSIENEHEQDSKEDHFVDKTVNEFVKGCILDYLFKNANLPLHEKEILTYNIKKEMLFDCNKLEADTVLFKQVLEAHPEIFQSSVNNFSEENFAKALEDLSRVSNPSLMNAINARVKEIAYDGKTAFSIRGDVAARLAGLKLNHQLQTEHDVVADKLLDGITKGHAVVEATGMEEEDLIREGTNLVRHDLDNQLTREEEREVVMELERIKYNSNPNNPQ